MNLWNRVKSLYVPPSAEVMAAQEYDAARRSLLEAQSAREYADSMCKYHEARIARLAKYIAGAK